MALASWLISLCALLAGASYAAWCLDRLPRTRRMLGVASVLCLIGAAWFHGEFIAAPAPDLSLAGAPTTFGR